MLFTIDSVLHFLFPADLMFCTKMDIKNTLFFGMCVSVISRLSSQHIRGAFAPLFLDFFQFLTGKNNNQFYDSFKPFYDASVPARSPGPPALRRAPVKCAGRRNGVKRTKTIKKTNCYLNATILYIDEKPFSGVQYAQQQKKKTLTTLLSELPL